MKCLVLALFLAGCGGHANVQGNSGGAPAGGVPGGTTVNVQGRSNFGNLLGLGFLVGVSYGSERGGSYYSSNPLIAISGGMSPAESVPEPDPTRRVVAQDCTKPIEDWSANLKCK
jgi:hypothetical protein